MKKELKNELEKEMSRLTDLERLMLSYGGIPVEYISEYKDLKNRIKFLKKTLTETL